MGFNTLRFRVDEPTGDAPPSEPVAAPAAPVTPPAAPPPSSGWTGPSQEEWEQTQSFQNAILQALYEPGEEEPGTPAEPPTFDFSTPEKVAEFVRAQVKEGAEKLYEERVGPYLPVLDKQLAEEGKAVVHAELTKIAKGDEGRGVQGIGDFDLEMAGRVAQAFHATGVPPEQAIRLAAQETRAYEERIRSSALAAQQGQINNRLEAGHVPAPTGAVHEQDAPRAGEDKYVRIAREWEERKRASGSPVG